MRITDKRGDSHKLTFGRTIYLGDRVVGTFTQSGGTATMHGFAIPVALQGRGIGPILLHHLEELLHKKHVAHVRISIPHEDCPIYAAFFAKHGFSRHGTVFSKHL